MAHEPKQLVTTVLLAPCAVRLTKMTVAQEYVLLQLTATAPTARCPRCAVPLVHNLRQALEAFLLNHRPTLQAAAVGTAMALTPPTGSVAVPPMY
jgi:hypothetical protein